MNLTRVFQKIQLNNERKTKTKQLHYHHHRQESQHLSSHMLTPNIGDH